MDELNELQEWFLNHCDGDWEHDAGIEIGTLDNPGWSLRVRVAGTPLESAAFAEISDLEPDREWIRCWLENGDFHAVGGPAMLKPMLRHFLQWATTASRASA